MSPIELAAAALGLVNIVLVVRRSVWNYPFALAMVSLYAWVFFGAKLYSDALLQIFFIVVNLYGWANWARSRAEAGEVRVESLGWPARAGWIVAVAAATALWGWLMHRHTDASFPWWDAGIAMLSVAGQILMSRRYWENWLFWIAADLIAVPLYAAKNLWATSALYAIFLAMCIVGVIGWGKARRG
ncbi:nicotinamide riboside transporter PnuC [Sphingomonas sp.]|uniref:nicotinamide riboside transporter PnuC n=1 Tax=Sphingomonas sp. TaxID=28214 RepID=UPI002C972EAB|nr:nicotinamide riboside transporter PnuC [Sphingomonas sp.]HWK37159.1 nicotinamide riboside transporter PnuC [Sphingomonas sp.]